MSTLRALLFLLLAAIVPTASTAQPQADHGPTPLQSLAGGKWRFRGELGSRIARNVDQWLLRAPKANPGILDMFHRRDRRLPYAKLVPWAGEFAGKYLISAVQACRMSDDPRLRPEIREFVRQLIACQASDGYLGPFPKAQRLMGECDLWGHYHCMLGLLMWHDDTGDQAAYDCVVRAADCICRLYVDGGRRPSEAGNPNFNLCVYHIFAELYRRTGSSRYLDLVRRIEEDLPKDGDWLRKGLAGVPYYRLPGSGPRWEALHLVQGFATMYRATGDERYKKSLLALWQSIRRLDRHPSGAFSTNEQASGTVYASGPIETCCSVAWMALTIDVLKLTGDPTAVDELELTLWNQALAAQHPSGSWCTYDTPLNGVRAPSYEQINFQYRPGAPELNCCSVNSPRTLGMLSEWAVMGSYGASVPAVAVNFYGPGTFDLPLPGGNRLSLTETTAYPVQGAIEFTVSPRRRSSIALRLRIPAWSAHTRLLLNGAAWPAYAKPGTYLTIDRTWSAGDKLRLELDMAPRYWAGRRPDREGRAAIHAGPLLLAFDAGLNSIETTDLKPIDVSKLKLVPVPVRTSSPWPPMGLWRTATEGGASILLCDFASAGARGTDYAAWLPASHMPPPPPGPVASTRPDGLMLDLPLAGTGKPAYGRGVRDEASVPAADRFGVAGRAVAFNAATKLSYELPVFPERDYSFVGWACPESLPSAGAEIFSAWCRGMDDPLRLIVAGSQLYARIEAGVAYSTAGVPLEAGRWVHVAAVKQGASLTLYINGRPAHTVAVPENVRSLSTEVGIGFNPLFSGGEHFIGRIAGVKLYARALTPDEVRAAFESP